MALVLGQQIVAIEVDGEEGNCRLRYRRWQHTAEEHATVCLAGPCAEWRLEHPGETPSSDMMRENLHVTDVADAAEHLGGPDCDRLVVCWGQAEALLADHWPAVESIAAALQHDGHLTGGEVALRWRGIRAAA